MGSNLRMLYLGGDSGTSRHRALSLSRLGHKVRTLDPHSFFPPGRLMGYWIHRTGALGLGRFIRSRILETIRSAEFDVVWVDWGDVICPELILDLKQRAKFVINYNVDDPYGPRDGNKWRLYLRSVPFYDLVVVVRDCNVGEAFKAGARDVMRVYRSSDEVAHAPRKLTPSDLAKWGSEVAFIGTWMPERGPFLARLVELGVPISIWGDRWSKAKEWPILRPHWRSRGLWIDDDYAMAVQGAKVCIGLLSKGNRDQSTQRSFEIPYLGGVLCAERTAEHTQLYREDEEAAFWSTPEECASKCMQLLRDEPLRTHLSINGRSRCLKNNTTNEAVLAQILYETLRPEQRQSNSVIAQTCGAIF
jgi:spore maturation protein CgeB